MPPRAGQKEESRRRIVESAGRGFRAHGYGGLGVDALAKDAGVTSGAFYAHFKSKADAFREAVALGLEGLRGRVERMRAENPSGWRAAFIDYYVGDRRTVDIANSCTLQNLTGEVARADSEAKRVYGAELERLIAATADGFDEGTPAERRAKAIAMLAILVGGVSMARAVSDETLSGEIAAAVERMAKGIG